MPTVMSSNIFRFITLSLISPLNTRNISTQYSVMLIFFCRGTYTWNVSLKNFSTDQWFLGVFRMEAHIYGTPIEELIPN